VENPLVLDGINGIIYVHQLRVFFLQGIWLIGTELLNTFLVGGLEHDFFPFSWEE